MIFIILLAPQVADAATLETCKSAVTESLSSFRQVSLEGDLLKIKERYKYNPTVGIGDFDSDGREDVALLVEQVASPHSRAIAVCLSSEGATAPVLISELYVGEALHVTPKGTKYFNYDTDDEGVYETDAISVSCCECCGATYVYKEGEFQEVVDSD